MRRMAWPGLRPAALVAALLVGQCWADRSCHLWQDIDDRFSRFTHVDGVLNDKYGLELKGTWTPRIAGKLLLTFPGQCPATLSALENCAFSLSSSVQEPVFLSYSEVKAGPASIKLSRLTAQMERSEFVISSAACEGPDLSGGNYCFSGIARIRAINGTATALGTPYNLAGAAGDFHLEGYVDADASVLQMHFTKIKAAFMIDTKEVKGPFNLEGHMETSAQLPYLFSFGAGGPARGGLGGGSAAGRPRCPSLGSRGVPDLLQERPALALLAGNGGLAFFDPAGVAACAFLAFVVGTIVGRQLRRATQQPQPAGLPLV